MTCGNIVIVKKSRFHFLSQKMSAEEYSHIVCNNVSGNMCIGNVIIEGDTRNRTAEAIIASNTVSDRRVPKVKMIMITVMIIIMIMIIW